MATRQYIGARYVPKFYQNSVDGSTQWESNVVYDPLTYVTLINGHMYISKKQVPATVGSPVSNIDYWLDIGSYNGFIEELQDEIDTINDTLLLKQDKTDNTLSTTDKTVVGAINEVKTGVDNNATAIATKQDKSDNTLTTTTKTVVGAINELDAKVDTIENVVGISHGNFIFIGDSYNNPSYSDWGNYAATELGLSASEYVSLYVDGGSIRGGQFNTLISNYAANLTQDEKDAVTHIVCCGGINDTVGTAADLKTQMASFINLCKLTFPNATVYMGFVGNANESSSILHNRDYLGVATNLPVYRECATIGAKYLAGLEYVLHDYSLIASDGIHPTQDGGAAIGKYIKVALENNGVAHITRNYNTTTTTDFIDTTTNVSTGISNVNVLSTSDNVYMLDVYEDDGITYFTHKGRIAIIMDTFLAVNNSITLNIGKSKLNLLNGKPPIAIPITGGCRKYNDNTYHNFTGTLQFNGGNMSIHVDMVNNDWETNFAADRILINEFAVSIPTMFC